MARASRRSQPGPRTQRLPTATHEGVGSRCGVAGESVSETTDSDPARVALLADAVSAYLATAFELDTD